MDPELEKRMVELQEQAKTVINLAVDGQVIGLIAIQDARRPAQKEAIKKLKERGLKTVMLTGDNERVAQAIAKQVGIDTVIADVLPQEKASAIQKLQEVARSRLLEMGSMMLQLFRSRMSESLWDLERILRLSPEASCCSRKMICWQAVRALTWVKRPL